MPDIDFGAAISTLNNTIGGPNGNFAFEIINQARVPADYLLNTFLPERLQPGYDVKAGGMTVRPTMAGLVGTDSPYPPSGMIDLSTFLSSTAKLANTVPLPEAFIRDLHAFLAALRQDQSSDEVVINQVLNFTQKMLVQAHLDRMELLRSDCLTAGAIDWTFIGKNLLVDYGIPTANKLTARTGSGNSYYGTTSKWWVDYAAGRSLLKQRVRAVLAHPDTIESIVSNPVNNIIITEQDLATGTVGFIKNVGVTATGPFIPSPDVRERTRMIGYGKEGEILDPATPGSTITVPFFPRGKVVMIGDAGNETGEGLGANDTDVQTGLELGYTHIGPTVEGRGQLGRWARTFVPESRPWSVQGDAVTNGLPVLRAPSKVVILTTDLP